MTRGALLLALAAFVASGCGGHHDVVLSSADTHELPLHPDGWCRDCDAGFVAGYRVPSRALFETLDAHGHEIDVASLRCDSCRAAVKSDGFCSRCRRGYVDEMAYLSRLTYHVARGKARDVDTIGCDRCRENVRDHGWCQRCQVGMVRHFEVPRREDFEPALAAFRNLEAALAVLPSCERCATATFTGGRCRIHGER